MKVKAYWSLIAVINLLLVVRRIAYYTTEVSSDIVKVGIASSVIGLVVVNAVAVVIYLFFFKKRF
jgi:hypothetical protein